MEGGLQRRIRRRRVRRLLGAGTVDSFGLSVGWTAVTLQVVAQHGLGAAAGINAAMLGGVALSAPVATLLSARLPGGVLLRWSAVGEGVLRVSLFALLAAGAPLPLLGAAVVVLHVLAWTGFAVMRAEVAAADPRPAAMTTYLMAIAAAEAVGAAVAALLPAGPDGAIGGRLAVAVAVLYGGALVPTVVIARRARTAPPAGAGQAASWARRATSGRPAAWSIPATAAHTLPRAPERPRRRRRAGRGWPSPPCPPSPAARRCSRARG